MLMKERGELCFQRRFRMLEAKRAVGESRSLSAAARRLPKSGERD